MFPYALVILMWTGAFFALTPALSIETSEAWLLLMSWALAGAIGIRRALAGYSWWGGQGASRASYLLIATLAWVCLSCVWAYNPGHAVGYALSVASFGVAAFSLKGWMAVDPKARGFFMTSLLFFLGANAVLSLGQFLHWPFAAWASVFPVQLGQDVFVPGTLWLHDYLLIIGISASNFIPVAIFRNQNFWAEFIVLAGLPVFAWVMGVSHRPMRLGAGLVLVLLAWAFVLAGCRAALGAIVVAPLVAAFVVWGPRGLQSHWQALPLRFKGGLGLGGLTLVSLVFFQNGQALSAKLTHLFDGSDLSTQLRLQIWKVALDMWPQALLQGQGVGSFKLLVEPAIAQAMVRFIDGSSMNRFVQLHNEPLQGLVEVGLVGVLMAAAALAAWGLEVLRNEALEPRLKWGLLSGVFGCLLAGCFGFPLHIPLTAFVLLALVAVGLAKPETMPDLAPAWRPAYAGGLAILCLLMGWQMSEKSVVAGVRAADHLLLSANMFGDGKSASAAAIAEVADQEARFKASARSARMQALLADQRPQEVIALYEASAKEGLGIETRLFYAEALILVGRPKEAIPQLKLIVALKGTNEELGQKANTLLSRLAG